MLLYAFGAIFVQALFFLFSSGLSRFQLFFRFKSNHRKKKLSTATTNELDKVSARL